jgi:hypothetical protein
MILPSCSMAISSPIVWAEARSWVIETAVEPRRRTWSEINSLIAAAVIGSRPVVGSSKNRISWLGDDGAGQAGALLHAARQLGREAVGDVPGPGAPAPGPR